jgi:hypothetical protein
VTLAVVTTATVFLRIEGYPKGEGGCSEIELLRIVVSV